MTAEQAKTHVQMVEEYATSRKGPLPPNKVIANDITESLGINLNPNQIESAIQHSRQHKVKSTPKALIYDGTDARRIQAIMLGKGNIWPDIEPYARLGMRGREIKIALLLEKDRDMSLESINQALGHRKRIGQLDKVTDEERYNVAQFIRHGTEEEIEGRVRLWLGLRDWFQVLGMETKQLKRMDWFRIMTVPQMSQVPNLEKSFQASPVEQLTLESLTLAGHLKEKFVADKADMRVFKEFREIIDRVDSMTLTLEEKERLFRCLLWEEKGTEAYAKFFVVPSNKLGKDIGQLIDDAEQLRITYDALWSDKKLICLVS